MNKFKLFILLVMNLFCILTNAQVTVNVLEENEHTSADFQLDSKEKGFAMPQIALTEIDNYSPIKIKPIDGLLVYNTTTNTTLSIGLYYWYQNRWYKLGEVEKRATIIQNIHEEYLGYKVTTTVNPPATLSNATKTICKKWEKSEGG